MHYFKPYKFEGAKKHHVLFFFAGKMIVFFDGLNIEITKYTKSVLQSQAGETLWCIFGDASIDYIPLVWVSPSNSDTVAN